MPLSDVDVMGHATSFFQSAWRASSRCEGTPLSFLRRVVRPRFKGGAEDRESEDGNEVYGAEGRNS